MTFTLHFQLHPINSAIFCYVVSFYKLLNKYFRLKFMSLKDNLLTISKLYCKNLRSYKLLNMKTPKKTIYTVRAFSFKKQSM